MALLEVSAQGNGRRGMLREGEEQAQARRTRARRRFARSCPTAGAGRMGSRHGAGSSGKEFVLWMQVQSRGSS